MAGDAGVEPALPEPESDVLPLDESPRYSEYIETKMEGNALHFCFLKFF